MKKIAIKNTNMIAALKILVDDRGVEDTLQHIWDRKNYYDERGDMYGVEVWDGMLKAFYMKIKTAMNHLPANDN